jgi:hypothetical protein
VGVQVTEVLGFGGPDVEVETVQADSQLRVVYLGDERRGGFQIIQQRSARLKLQGQANAVVPRHVCRLTQQAHDALQDLRRNGVVDVADDDQNADAQAAAHLQPAAEEIPGLLSALVLTRQQAPLKTRNGGLHFVLLEHGLGLFLRVLLHVLFQLGQPHFDGVTLARRVIFDIALEGREQRTDLAERGNHGNQSSN